MYDTSRSLAGDFIHTDFDLDPAHAAQSNANERIRLLLKHFGLRTSLIRLKVIDVLRISAQSGRLLGARGIHSQLQELGIPSSFLSVREVLKRLYAEGVVILNPDKSYSLQEQAAALLDECRSHAVKA